MIDTHCHIDFKDFDSDREEVIKRAKDKLDYVVASGFDKDSNQNVLELSKEYEGFIYPTFGFHPVSSQNSTDEELKDAQKHLIDNLSSCRSASPSPSRDTSPPSRCSPRTRSCRRR